MPVIWSRERQAYVLDPSAEQTELPGVWFSPAEVYALLEIDPSTLLFSVPDHFQVAGGVRWSVLGERLTLQMGGIYDLSYQEYMAAGPLAAWRVNDHLQFELGGVVLQGFKTPPPKDFIESLAALHCTATSVGLLVASASRQPCTA